MEEKKIFKIEKLDEDNYKVVSLVNGAEIPFKKNVELARRMQSVNANARLKMITWMKEAGITKNDLIDKIEKNGKIIYDETTYRTIEQGFIQDESTELGLELYKILFNKTVTELITELGFTANNEDEALRLGTEINAIITEKAPR